MYIYMIGRMPELKLPKEMFQLTRWRSGEGDEAIKAVNKDVPHKMECPLLYIVLSVSRL